MNAHLPTGSSDEIFIPSSTPLHFSTTDRSQPGHAAEETLQLALRAQYAEAIPRWVDVLVVARSLTSC